MNKFKCLHYKGVMIPTKDIKGNYIKPEFALCTDCRGIISVDQLFGK